MKIKETAFKEIVKKIDAFEKRLAEHGLHGHPDLPRLLSSYGKKAGIDIFQKTQYYSVIVLFSSETFQEFLRIHDKFCCTFWYSCKSKKILQ